MFIHTTERNMKRNTPSAKSSSSSGSPPEEVYLNDDLLRKTQCKHNQAQAHLKNWAMSSIEEALHHHATKLEEAIQWNKQLLSNIRQDKTLIEEPRELFSHVRFAAKQCVKSVKDSEETFCQLLQQDNSLGFTTSLLNCA